MSLIYQKYTHTIIIILILKYLTAKISLDYSLYKFLVLKMVQFGPYNLSTPMIQANATEKWTDTNVLIYQMSLW